MKKLILFVLCALSGLMVSAQSRWGITPEGGFAAVNRVGMGSSWRAGVKVGVGVSYQFEPGWIGLKSGLYYANRGYSLGRLSENDGVCHVCLERDDDRWYHATFFAIARDG